MTEPRKTLLQALTDALHPDHRRRSNPVELREDSARSKCQPITLKTGNGQALLLRSDDSQGVGKWLTGMFDQSVPKITQICDYIIFYQRNPAPGERGQSRLFVLPCELKSDSRGSALTQITNGKLLGEYLIAMVRNNVLVENQPEIVYRGLIFRSHVAVPRLSLTADRPPDYEQHPQMEDFKFITLPCGREQTLSSLCRE